MRTATRDNSDAVTGLRGLRVAIAIAVATIVLAGSAMADQVALNNIQFSTGYLAGIVSRGTADESVWAGRILANGTLPLFCVDLDHNTYLGCDYTYTRTEQYGRIGYLAALQPTTTDESAGLQLAIWEATYENSAPNPGSLSAGFFTARGFDSNALRLADQYLAASEGKAANYYLYTHGSGDAQNLVSAAPVPEPGSLMVLIPGIAGMIGMAARRRRQA